MKLNYILKGHIPVIEPDTLKWAKWFTTAERHVALDVVGDTAISTVFLGVDHNFYDQGDPVLFETMVFRGPLDSEMERYRTWDEAVEGHRAMVKKVTESMAKITD